MRMVRHKDFADEEQAYSLLTSTSSTTPRLHLRPCSLLQWAHDKAGTFLSAMLVLRTYTYKKDVITGDVMAGGASTEDALEARSQAERLQADRVWVQEPKNVGANCRALNRCSYSETCRS